MIDREAVEAYKAQWIPFDERNHATEVRTTASTPLAPPPLDPTPKQAREIRTPCSQVQDRARESSRRVRAANGTGGGKNGARDRRRAEKKELRGDSPVRTVALMRAEGISRREIAKRTGLAWATVRDYITKAKTQPDCADILPDNPAAAYNRGMAEMRERCAVVADAMRESITDEGYKLAQSEIAAAIRGLK